MKELTIEEKAKRYDEAIEKLRSLHDDYDTVSTLIDIKEELEQIISELKESDDDRIRKEIIKFIKVSKPEWENYRDYSSWIAWLEKQGEQKPYSGVSFKYNGHTWECVQEIME